MRIAYLVNQYPMASLTFIRREIAALESMGHHVARFALQRWVDTLVDDADITEADKTRYVKELGIFRLGVALLWCAIRVPGVFLRTLKLSVQVAARSDRSQLYHLAYLAEACVLRDWLLADGVEHLHVHFATNSTTVAMLAHELGGPGYSFMVHGPGDFDRAVGLALDEKVHRADFVTTISNFARSQILRWCHTQDWAKVKIVRCGLDSDFVGREVAPPCEAPRLVSIGRLSEQKGQLLLVEAAARLAEQGHDFELILIGDGEMRDAIEAAIRHHHLEDKVKLFGWATNAEVIEQLNSSRGLVLASFAEGLPVVIMEALALGRPVVTTWIAGIPELVRPGINGWLVAPGDVDSLTAAMQQLLAAPLETLATMGSNGQEAVARMHDVRQEAQTLDGYIKAAVAARRAPELPGA